MLTSMSLERRSSSSCSYSELDAFQCLFNDKDNDSFVHSFPFLLNFIFCRVSLILCTSLWTRVYPQALSFEIQSPSSAKRERISLRAKRKEDSNATLSSFNTNTRTGSHTKSFISQTRLFFSVLPFLFSIQSPFGYMIIRRIPRNHRNIFSELFPLDSF